MRRIFVALILFINGTCLFPDDVFKSDSFIQQTLRKFGGDYVTNISSYLIYNYDYGFEPYIEGSVYYLPFENALQAARALASKKGDYYAFVIDPGVLAIAVTTDQYELLKAICTGYVNTSIDEISSNLHKWESKFAFRIIGIGHQFIILDILSGNVDYTSVANDISSFCPGVVNIGTHTISNLADQIKRNNSIYLWWTYNYGFIK